MAVTTGAALIIPFTVGTSQIVGQGNFPIVRCRISFDDYAESTPVWNEVTNSDFRGYSTSRGRENEQQTHDAGTATVVLDNRDRAYDPNVNATVTPMNGLWLYEEFSGEVRDIFKGYVDAWQQGWPDGGWSDAVVTATATDEFKVLAMQAVPTTSPPRGTYADLVAVDIPTGYWRLNEDPDQFIQEPVNPPPNPNPPDPRSLGGWLRGRVSGWWTD